jgi:transposase-like protein
MVQAIYDPDVTVSLVARRNAIQHNQLFAWRKLVTKGALTGTRDQKRSWRLPHIAPCLIGFASSSAFTARLQGRQTH